jgi:hypothetical protein
MVRLSAEAGVGAGEDADAGVVPHGLIAARSPS